MEPLESFSQPSLPNDLIFEILSKLPVKNLLRFRAVCKSWRQLISNPVFINSHLQNSQRHNSGTIRNALLDQKNAPTPRPCICQGATRDEQVHEFIRDFSANAGDDHRWRVIFCGGPFTLVTLAGCCNGLICFYQLCEYNSDMHIYLWNPALNQCRVLPESNYNRNNFSFHSITVCLVYNAVTNDYQVVKILYLLESGFYKAEIYSLSTNSWKQLISEFFPNKEKHFLYLYWDGVAHNGFPHWLARCENLPSAMCVLDMNEEKIHQIPLPEEVYKREDSHLELFQGCLSIFFGLLIPRTEKFELWVLKEQGKDISWIKKTVVAGDLGITLLHHRTTEVTGNIFASDRRRRLVSYDLENERVAEKQLQDDRVLGWPNYCYYVVDYVASLISLDSVI